MCEILIDGFSLLNSDLDDADMGILGSDSGLTLGNPEIVHQVVDSLLRNDQIIDTVEGTGRQQTIPIRINGPHSAARADMAAQVHKALQNPRKVSLIPCDGWGAEAWWRIQWASMEYVSDDFAARYNDYQLYTITLGVSPWALSTETYTATLTPSGTNPYVWGDLDIPGSAPFAGDITVAAATVGCLVYTPGSIMVDYPSYNPVFSGTGGLLTLANMPEGTYHLIADVSGAATSATWSVAGQSGTVDLTGPPYNGGTGFMCLANDIYLSPYSASGNLVVTPSTGTWPKTFLLWVGNPLTGQTASYTMTGLLSGTPFKVVAPTAARPVVAQTVNGVQASTELRAVGGEHQVNPGATKILAAWKGTSGPVGASVSVSGNPAYLTDVVPSSRW
jgi:hypothetical protein